MSRNNWEDSRYMDWADQERLIRHDIEVMEEMEAGLRHKSDPYRKANCDERIEFEGSAESGQY